jgi:mannosyltransferase OCH1-like enzyme
MEAKEINLLVNPNIKKDQYIAWLYWEGDCPEWILKCRETVVVHSGNQLCLITPAEFNLLWKKDKDIDLSELCTAHRADFIRSYLLFRYGGIWIDSDCLVMKSLLPLFELLNKYDFLGYRERNGAVTNNFMGASKGSIIAKEYYQKVCGILRSGQKLEWLSIGSDALTSTIEQLNVEWYELKVEQIQPVCWSNPEAFFKLESEAQHSEKYNEDSYCYMISANMANGVVREHPEESLLKENSFFNFLYHKSIKV